VGSSVFWGTAALAVFCPRLEPARQKPASRAPPPFDQLAACQGGAKYEVFRRFADLTRGRIAGLHPGAGRWGHSGIGYPLATGLPRRPLRRVVRARSRRISMTGPRAPLSRRWLEGTNPIWWPAAPRLRHRLVGTNPIPGRRPGPQRHLERTNPIRGSGASLSLPAGKPGPPSGSGSSSREK
jgi:hypothetical protein